MEKLKLLKGEVEKILQENHTSKENRLAFANGVIYALANVTTGLKGKERFLRDYTEGILHAAYVLYEKRYLWKSRRVHSCLYDKYRLRIQGRSMFFSGRSRRAYGAVGTGRNE